MSVTGILSDPNLADYRTVLAHVYRDDPVFVHPDVGFLSRVLSGKSAYLRHGAVQAYAVPGSAFAVAFVDPRQQERAGRAVGSVGFFEAASQDAAMAVLDAACGWLAQLGVTDVWAPLNGNPLYGVGLREDRFDGPPFLGSGHQPSTYCSYLEVAGFTRHAGYGSFEVDLTGEDWRGPSADMPGIGFRTASRLRFRDEIARFITMHNEAFGTVRGEADVSIEEGLELMGRARLAVVPSLFQFAVRDGDDVGLVLCLPDLNEVLAPQRKPLTSPSGVARMALRRRRVKTVGLETLAVQPSHQGRGIGTALVARACRAAADLGYRRLEYALVEEDNEASKSTIRRFGGKLSRTFGVYAKEL